MRKMRGRISATGRAASPHSKDTSIRLLKTASIIEAATIAGIVLPAQCPLVGLHCCRPAEPMNAPPPPPPAEMDWVTRVAGPEAALILLEKQGGIALYIPHSVSQASPLARVVGLAAARQLAEAYGGEQRVVPLLRWWRVQLERSRGLSNRAIARKLSMTEIAVTKLLRYSPRRGAADPAAASASQLDLFSA